MKARLEQKRAVTASRFAGGQEVVRVCQGLRETLAPDGAVGLWLLREE